MKQFDTMLAPCTRYIALLMLGMLPLLVGAQTDVKVQDVVFISNGTPVFITGSLSTDSGSELTNGDELHVTGDVDLAAGTHPYVSNGTLLLVGTGAQTIGANGEQVSRLYNNNSAGTAVLFTSDVHVRDYLELNNDVEVSDAEKLRLDYNTQILNPSGGRILGPAYMRFTEASSNYFTVGVPFGIGTETYPLTLTGYEKFTTGPGPYTDRWDRLAVEAGSTGGVPAAKGMHKVMQNRYFMLSNEAGGTDWAHRYRYFYNYNSNDDLTSLYTNQTPNLDGIVVARHNGPTPVGTFTSLFQGHNTGSLGGSGVISSMDYDTMASSQTRVVVLASRKHQFDEAKLANNSSVQTVCDLDTSRASVVNADGTNNWEKSDDNATWAGAGASATDYTVPRGGTTQYYRSVIDGPAFEPDTTPALTVNRSLSTKLNLRVFLEGPYHPAGDSMYAKMMDGSGFRLDTFFASTGSAPRRMWAGTTLSPRTVDAVKLEFRTNLNTPTNDTAWAWLMTDGTLRDFNTGDSANVGLCGLTPGSYYVVVRHRNHLTIASKNPIALGTTAAATPFNLSSMANIYWADMDGATQLGASRWGMWAGNVNETPWAPQEVNALDYFSVLMANGLDQDGYFAGDCTLDGNVNSADVLVVQSNNDNLVGSMVPNP